MAESIENAIKDTIFDILQQKGLKTMQISPHSRLAEDLSFTSLDLAQFVAVMQLKSGRDPFATTVSVISIKLVIDLYRAYGVVPR